MVRAKDASELETEGTDNAAMGTSNALQSEQRGGFTGLKDLLPSEIH